MKAIYEQLDVNTDSSFLYRRFSLPKFNAPYHYHPELELTYIEKGFGRRFVGRNVGTFEPGDLVLLGSNLPHFWQSSEQTPAIYDEAKAIVIQFNKNLFGEPFFNLPESKSIAAIINKANAGILIKGQAQIWITEKMKMFDHFEPFQKLLLLLEILQTIALSDDTELLDQDFANYHFSTHETERFQNIYAFLIENYTNEISLETISSVANLTPTAFCRYFKKITGKTFIDVLTNYRISQACFLLSTTHKPISDICFESGFGNISYFNKEFKKAMGSSPLSYRKSFLQ